MKKIFGIMILVSLFTTASAQTASTDSDNKYIRSADDLERRVAYTELIINVTPSEVRKKFLKFEDWPSWNSVITSLKVIQGDLDDISKKTRVDALFKMDTTKKPTKAPMKLWVTENSNEAFVWEVKNGLLLRAYHVFLFLPTPDGKSTRLVHYEKMTGFLSLFMSKKVKANMVERYGKMNFDLKKLCEESTN